MYVLRTLVLLLATLATAHAADRPNILVIMADDIGPTNVSAYSQGLMGQTPNIDRIAREGMLFTDHYSEPSCTPGRAAFITGQYPIRTGLTTVGLPNSPIGIDARDPTLAEVLKPLGYVTGQFGKNHLGDRDQHLPTAHGFDEFFGNLYHLNAEEEPEQLEYPAKELAKYRPRGVIDAKAGPDGYIKDTGPLTRKRMESVDDEFTSRTVDFIERAVKGKKPFFVWHNPSRNHIYIHPRPEFVAAAAKDSSEDDIYRAGMIELDGHVGQILKKLDDLGVAKNTIVVFTSDNGPMTYHWPQAGTTPFHGEKASTWEGGVRVPTVVRWPGKVPAGSISNGIQSHLDLFTTLAAAAGVKDVAAELRASHKVHIDGINNLQHWQGQGPSLRENYIYYNESTLSALRWRQWKVHAKEKNGFFDYFRESSLIFNLKMDPYEQHGGLQSNILAQRKAWIGGIIRDIITEHMRSLQEFPPRQKGGSLRGGMELVK
jgi:arylsulfatase A-like enzyme